MRVLLTGTVHRTPAGLSVPVLMTFDDGTLVPFTLREISGNLPAVLSDGLTHAVSSSSTVFPGMATACARTPGRLYRRIALRSGCEAGTSGAGDRIAGVPTAEGSGVGTVAVSENAKSKNWIAGIVTTGSGGGGGCAGSVTGGGAPRFLASFAAIICR